MIAHGRVFEKKTPRDVARPHLVGAHFREHHGDERDGDEPEARKNAHAEPTNGSVKRPPGPEHATRPEPDPLAEDEHREQCPLHQGR